MVTSIPKRHSCDVCDVRGKHTKTITFSLSAERWAMVKALAAQDNMTMSAWIRHALDEYLNGQDGSGSVTNL